VFGTDVLEDDVIKVGENMPTQPPCARVSEPNVLFEVGPDVPDVPLLHLPESQSPTTKCGRSRLPESELVIVHYARPCGEEEKFKPSPNACNLPSTDGYGIQLELTKSPIKSKLPAQGEQGLKSLPTSIPSSSVIAEMAAQSVEKIPGMTESRKQLSTEEVKTWLGQQSTQKRALPEQPEVQKSKKRGRPVGSTKKLIENMTSGITRGMQILEEHA
jgi:hypothetical protein